MVEFGFPSLSVTVLPFEDFVCSSEETFGWINGLLDASVSTLLLPEIGSP